MWAGFLTNRPYSQQWLSCLPTCWDCKVGAQLKIKQFLRKGCVHSLDGVCKRLMASSGGIFLMSVLGARRYKTPHLISAVLAKYLPQSQMIGKLG